MIIFIFVAKRFSIGKNKFFQDFSFGVFIFFQFEYNTDIESIINDLNGQWKKLMMMIIIWECISYANTQLEHHYFWKASVFFRLSFCLSKLKVKSQKKSCFTCNVLFSHRNISSSWRFPPPVIQNVYFYFSQLWLHNFHWEK